MQILLKLKVALFFSVNAENDKKINDKMINFGLRSRLKRNMDPWVYCFLVTQMLQRRKFFQY